MTAFNTKHTIKLNGCLSHLEFQSFKIGFRLLCFNLKYQLMASISQLTQSRLGVLLFNKTTNALQNKIPVYIEKSITVELPPYTADQHLEFNKSETPIRQWLSNYNFVFKSFNNVIIRNVAETALGIRHDDPCIGIEWPTPATVISE